MNFECSSQNWPNFWHFWNNKSVFLQISRIYHYTGASHWRPNIIAVIAQDRWQIDDRLSSGDRWQFEKVN